MTDFEKLGIKEGASIDDIQKAYRVKMLLFHQIEEKTQEDKDTFSEVTTAYNRLCGFDVEKEPEERYSKFKDFMHYNKEKFFIAGYLVIIVAIFFFQFRGRPNYDLNIAIIGHYSHSEHGKFVGIDVVRLINERIQEQTYGVETSVTRYYPRGAMLPNTPEFMNVQVMLTTHIMSGEIDLFIIDEENYLFFLESDMLIHANGLFYDLSDFVALQSEENEIPEELLVIDDDGRILGISLSQSEFIFESGIVYNRDLIASIFNLSQRKDVAFAAILELL